jgi:hypothetical protein
MTHVMLKRWRTIVVRRLRQQGLVNCVSQIKQIRECGTVLLTNQTEIATNICLRQLVNISHF